MSSKALEQARSGALKAILEDQAQQDGHLLQDAGRAEEFDSYEDARECLARARALQGQEREAYLKELGFESLNKLRRAVHGQLRTSDAPIYLAAAFRRQEVRVRNGHVANTGNQVIIMNMPPPEMRGDVIDVESDE